MDKIILHSWVAKTLHWGFLLVFIYALTKQLVNVSYVLILGHIGAAIYHRRKGDGIWSAMVPVWKEPGAD